MRYNEGRGISLENIFPGKIEDKTLAGSLSGHRYQLSAKT